MAFLIGEQIRAGGSPDAGLTATLQSSQGYWRVDWTRHDALRFRIVSLTAITLFWLDPISFILCLDCPGGTERETTIAMNTAVCNTVGHVIRE